VLGDRRPERRGQDHTALDPAGLLATGNRQHRLRRHAARRTAARERARRRGFLPQDSVGLFPASVLETALTAGIRISRAGNGKTADDVEHVRAALAALGLAGLEARDVRTLSAGNAGAWRWLRSSRKTLGCCCSTSRRPSDLGTQITGSTRSPPGPAPAAGRS